MNESESALLPLATVSLKNLSGETPLQFSLILITLFENYL
jgi:hypothetical protein